jgi:hypothetical protein
LVTELSIPGKAQLLCFAFCTFVPIIDSSMLSCHSRHVFDYNQSIVMMEGCMHVGLDKVNNMVVYNTGSQGHKVYLLLCYGE